MLSDKRTLPLRTAKRAPSGTAASEPLETCSSDSGKSQKPPKAAPSSSSGLATNGKSLEKNHTTKPCHSEKFLQETPRFGETRSPRDFQHAVRQKCLRRLSRALSREIVYTTREPLSVSNPPHSQKKTHHFRESRIYIYRSPKSVRALGPSLQRTYAQSLFNSVENSVTV